MIRGNVTNMINSGTAWQHYGNEEYSPVNLYAATKQAFETILQYYVEAAGLKVVTLTLTDTYGPLDRRRKIFKVLKDAFETASVIDMSPGEQLLDFVHIDDVVDAYVLAAAELVAGRIAGHQPYAVRSNERLRLRDVVSFVEGATGKKLPIRWSGRPYRSREMMVPWTEGRTLPGWKATKPLKSNIDDAIKE